MPGAFNPAEMDYLTSRLLRAAKEAQELPGAADQVAYTRGMQNLLLDSIVATAHAVMDCCAKRMESQSDRISILEARVRQLEPKE